MTPRRCSSRWLDGDCPAEVLAIIDHGAAQSARYDIIYTDTQMVTYEGSSRIESWLQGTAISEYGVYHDHFEMQAHEVAAYRYRMKHRYAKWSTLPDAVKNAVRQDLAAVDS